MFHGHGMGIFPPGPGRGERGTVGYTERASGAGGTHRRRRPAGCPERWPMRLLSSRANSLVRQIPARYADAGGQQLQRELIDFFENAPIAFHWVDEMAESSGPIGPNWSSSDTPARNSS